MELKLKIKILDIYANYSVCILHPTIAKKISAQNLDRIDVKKEDFNKIFVLDTSNTYVDEKHLGVFKDTAKEYGLIDGEEVVVSIMSPPPAIRHIFEKINNKHLSKSQIIEIVEQINKNAISDVELAGFVTACQINGLSLEEITYFCDALVDIGDKIDFEDEVILDKHSIGGINGRVSMIVTPIIASFGYKIPKTASRSITSATGTADAMEMLAPVALTVEEIKEIVSKANGVVAWEGKFDLCPVDNKIIDVEHALGINPEGIMIASILSKKKSIGSTHLIIDIPVGKEMKIKNVDDAERLAKKFLVISKELGIKTKVLITDGKVPCGNTFGCSLEAKSALEILEGKYFDNLAEKSCEMAGELLELVGRAKLNEGYGLAKKAIESKQALNKFIEIINAQGGSITKSEDLPKANFVKEVLSPEEGTIIDMDVSKLTTLAKYAGAPTDNVAGVVILKTAGSTIKKNEPLFEIHSNSESRLNYAYNYSQKTITDLVTFKRVIVKEINE
jgi:AMP phosphorylase